MDSLLFPNMDIVFSLKKKKLKKVLEKSGNFVSLEKWEP